MADTELRMELDFYRWRPISEIHEDFGPCVLIDIRKPGQMALGNNLDLDFEQQRWTHFSRITPLSIEEAQKLAAELPARCLRLVREVESDLPFPPFLIAEARVYEPEEISVNPHGAVSVMTPKGLLGVKPGEFEWMESE